MPFGEVNIPGAQQFSRLVGHQNGGIALVERDNQSGSRNYHASMGPADSGIGSFRNLLPAIYPSINLRPTANVHIPFIQTTIDCESRDTARLDNDIRPLRQIARFLSSRL